MTPKIYTVPAKDVVVPEERMRKEFSQKSIDRLTASIKGLRQLQPGICTYNEDGKPVLVSGERRLRACIQAGCDYQYVLRDDADELMLLEIELEENVCRENLSWLELVRARAKLHLFREQNRADGKAQTIRDTAKELDRAVGGVQEDLELAQFADSFEEVATAPNRTEAKKVIKRMKSDLLRSKMLDGAIKKAEESKARVAPTKASPLEQAQEKLAKKQDKEENGGAPISQRLLDYDKRVVCAEFFNFMKGFKEESIDVVYFDPPWGVDYDKNKVSVGSQQAYEDSKEKIWEKMPEWLGEIFLRLKQDSHLYMFFGIVHFERVYSLLEEVGFKVNRMPIFWYKQGARRTRNPKIWPARCYEPIAFARKGSKDLAVQGARDIIITQPPFASLKKSHPSAKHPDVYLDLIKRSCLPGNTIVDPMCGSGAFGVAADMLQATLKPDWWMGEESLEHRNLALENTVKGYHELLTVDRKEAPKQSVSNVGNYENDNPLPEDFRELIPGSHDWKRFWKNADQETQTAMLDWRAEQEKE